MCIGGSENFDKAEEKSQEIDKSFITFCKKF